jgi:hypothetical protein
MERRKEGKKERRKEGKKERRKEGKKEPPPPAVVSCSPRNSKCYPRIDSDSHGSWPARQRKEMKEAARKKGRNEGQ